MNDFNITVKSEPFYAQDHYGAPVVIFDDIKLEPKTLSYQMSAQASIDVLKDIASKELAKTIAELNNDNQKKIVDLIDKNIQFKKTINKLCYATIGLSSLLVASSIAIFVAN